MLGRENVDAGDLLPVRTRHHYRVRENQANGDDSRCQIELTLRQRRSGRRAACRALGIASPPSLRRTKPETYKDGIYNRGRLLKRAWRTLDTCRLRCVMHDFREGEQQVQIYIGRSRPIQAHPSPTKCCEMTKSCTTSCRCRHHSSSSSFMLYVRSTSVSHIVLCRVTFQPPDRSISPCGPCILCSREIDTWSTYDLPSQPKGQSSSYVSTSMGLRELAPSYGKTI